jgi:hypothetical protein
LSERTGKIGETVMWERKQEGEAVGRRKKQEGEERKDKRVEEISTERRLAKGKRQLGGKRQVKEKRQL